MTRPSDIETISLTDMGSNHDPTNALTANFMELAPPEYRMIRGNPGTKQEGHAVTAWPSRYYRGFGWLTPLPLNRVTEPGVKPVPEPVADEVQRHHQEEDHHTREERDPPGGRQVVTAFRNHRTPCGGGWRDTGPEEAQNRLWTFYGHAGDKKARRK